jgi:hypothetical protein
VNWVGTAVAVGLAELYGEIIGTEAGTGRMVRGPERCRMAGEALAVVVGAGFPAVFFALAAAGAIEVRLAFSLSKWSGLALICGYGALAARLAAERVAERRCCTAWPSGWSASP